MIHSLNRVWTGYQKYISNLFNVSLHNSLLPSSYNRETNHINVNTTDVPIRLCEPNEYVFRPNNMIIPRKTIFINTIYNYNRNDCLTWFNGLI